MSPSIQANSRVASGHLEKGVQVWATGSEPPQEGPQVGRGSSLQPRQVPGRTEEGPASARITRVGEQLSPGLGSRQLVADTAQWLTRHVPTFPPLAFLPETFKSNRHRDASF